MDYNYFEVLELSINDIQDKDEATIKKRVNDAHTKLYALTIGAYANVPRSDGLTQAQWQTVLNDAKDTLLNPRKRQKHIATLTEAPEELEQPVLTFPGGEEARSIADLATLMEQHATHAADALYTGTLAQNLQSLDQNQFADAAETIVDRFSDDRDTGRTAMVAVLHGEVRMEKGKGANTPKQLARLIDKNWDQSKTLLYNGFFAFWLAHIEQQQLADTANEVTNRYSDEQDLALEAFVQELDPGIGNPIPNISHSEIHFNTVAAGSTETPPSETNNIAKTAEASSAKTIRSEIKNAGRGFLHGDVHLKNDIPGLQLSDTKIHGGGTVSIHLDESVSTSKEAHRTALVIDTNGQNLEVPIYINHGIQPLLRWVGISGVSMAALALFTRLIVATAPLNVAWAGTLILGIGVYAHWLLVVSKSFSWQRFLMPILPIILATKNFFQSQDYRKLINVLFRTFIRINKWQIAFFAKTIKYGTKWATTNIRWSRIPIFLFFLVVVVVVIFGIIGILFYTIAAMVVDWILTVVLAPFLALALILTGLDKLFHLGFSIPIVVGWAFWGLIIGLAIQGYRAMEIYDRKRMKLWVAAAPILLLAVMGTIRYISDVSVSNSPSTETAPITTQGTTGLETQITTDETPESGSAKKPIVESEGASVPPEEPASINEQQRIVPPPPNTQNESKEPTPIPPKQDVEPTPIPPKQDVEMTLPPAPKPATPSVPSDMVLIPAGEFQMGSNDNTDEKPIHTVHIDAFYIDKYEVTRSEIRRLSVIMPRMGLGSMTWQGTFWSGVLMRTMVISMLPLRVVIR